MYCRKLLEQCTSGTVALCALIGTEQGREAVGQDESRTRRYYLARGPGHGLRPWSTRPIGWARASMFKELVRHSPSPEMLNRSSVSYPSSMDILAL